jgi:hypothetical protein
LLTRRRGVDWFEKLTGFPETNYVDTRAKLAVEGERLRSLVNGKSYGVGRLELVSLETLRQRTNPTRGPVGKLRVSLVSGNVREMHRRPENSGALFQVASQFNLLEMIGPNINPEHGVTRYQNDPTQGPACAIAAGAATIYRNYFAPVAGLNGQTKERQIDGLAPLGEVLSESLKQPVEVLWKMQNGYALCTRTGLNAISEHITSLRPEQIDALRGKLSVGIHSDVEVTESNRRHCQRRSTTERSSAPPCLTTETLYGDFNGDDKSASIVQLHQPKRAKSPAQRAREYRARKKKASVGNPTPPAPTVTARHVTAMTPAVTSRPITDVTSPVTPPPVTPSRRPGRLPPPPGFTDLEKSTAELVARPACITP